MIEPRQRGAKTLGHAVPYYAPQPCAPARYCQRCGCRLSRYAEYTATHCAPCSERLYPWTPRDDQTMSRRAWYWHQNKGITCACGATKTAGSRSCLKCHLAMIGRDHPTWYGLTCQCGGRKTCGARMCRSCRYPNGAM